MARVSVPFPILPEKTADDVKGVIEEFRRRPDEYAESRRRLGITLEREYLQTTPMGMFTIVYIESATNFGEVAAALGRSDLEIDKYFVKAVREIHGFDVTQPPAGPPPETVGEWVDSQVRERRQGMACCAPMIPGTEDQGRAFMEDAFNRPAMTESRRALQQNVEVVTLVQTPEGPVAAIYLEGEDPWDGNRRFAASTSTFDVWFKDELAKIFPPIIDFGQPIPGVKEIFDSRALLARA